ncbi:MAG: N-acetylneuraminate synthase family protein, partial [Candidatus Spechtbacteria bacterium]|nr:N-acetylneuraminate synthase family protein [Candidatus Spechtbacteria bacterium]
MSKTSEIKIGDKIIGAKNPVYIIAEIGLNHQGDPLLAKKLIDIAAEAKCDCVKFQKRTLSKVYTKEALEKPEEQEHGIEYVIRHLEKTELSEDHMRDLYDYTKTKGIDFMCSPWDEESVRFLASLPVLAYKIASADMTNVRLIETISRLHKPMFISTGMSFVSEITELVKFLRNIKAEFILLHCNSTYPAPYYDINLRFLKTMQEKFQCIVGYSGHERGTEVALAAVAMGAKVIEKHLTLDRNLPGPDHKASLEPDELKNLVRQIRIVETALGEPVRYPSRGEYLNRETLSKSIVAAKNLKKGQVLKAKDIEIKSPGKGVSPLKLNYFIGKKLTRRNISEDQYILESDIRVTSRETPRKLRASHRWGVVARMSDIDEMVRCNSAFIEIHLADTDINLDKTYTKTYDRDLTVHGPEYDRDLLMDLSSLDEDTRTKSIAFFNKA